MTRHLPILALAVLLPHPLFVADDLRADDTAQSVQEIAASVRDSIVVVTTEDGQGKQTGLGTGFVIDAEGLIATSLHVIHQSRPIWVQTRGDKRYSATAVHAYDRQFDLAILRIAPDAPLVPIPLGSGELEIGEQTVAIGHPLGLRHSVVSGVVAGERDFDGQAMWQVAMGIEPGNSGGPLLDLQGQVQGIVAMKSVGESFGFAVKANLLRKLLASPNPTAMEHWPTSVRLNTRLWAAKMGARWTQRGGRIQVDTAGEGFGGRSLLLRVDETPELPFELAVSVKLADESGAAGLVFHSDGNDRHYGFYPSNGSLRLTNFDGPSVFSWNVVREIAAASYKPGQWNEIRVRVEKDKVTAFVNNQWVASIDEVRQPLGKIGLCKFRDTKAEFKNFRFGKSFTSQLPTQDDLAALGNQLATLPQRDTITDQHLGTFLDQFPTPAASLEQQAMELEARATELRLLRDDLHTAAVCKELAALTAKPNAEIDLLEGALWISKLDNPDIDVKAYLQLVDEIAEQVKASLPADATAGDKVERLREFLFRESGYYGSRLDYYSIQNSHMHRVLDDRVGIPITLSIFYMAMADRLGLPLVGVGLPGHFVVRYEPVEGESQLIDVFDGGKILSRAEAEQIVLRTTGRPATDEVFVASTSQEILRRVLSNMQGIAQASQDIPALLRYLEALVAISPEELSYRGLRGVLRYQLGRKTAARDDFDWLLDHADDLAPGQRRQIEMFRRQMDASP